MSDIKKVNSGSQLRPDTPRSVLQAVAASTEGSTGASAPRATPPAIGVAGPGRCAVYARVSSDQQEKDGTIASQLEGIARYASEHGLTYQTTDIFSDDGYPGTVLHRPHLDKLLDKVHEGCYDRVLILSPDRLARNYGHQIMLIEELQNKGCQPVFIHRPIGQGPDDELLLQMQGIIAQYEHSKIQERTRRGKLHRMRRGELVSGRRVFGYRYIRGENGVPAHYEVADDEAQIVRDMYRSYVHDNVSLSELAIRLVDQKIASVRGGRWTGAHIGYMLRNHIYTGTGYANKIESVEPKQQAAKRQYRKHLKSSHRTRPQSEWMAFSAPPIVTEEEFELAQQRLAQNTALSARRTKRPYLLRGLMTCEVCHFHVYCDTQSSNYICAHSRPAYAKAQGHCQCVNKRRIPVAKLDDLVWSEVKAMLEKPELLKKHHPSLRDKIHPRAAGSLAAIETKIATISKQITRINDLYVQGMVDKEAHAKSFQEFKQRKTELEQQRLKIQGQHMENQEIVELMDSFSGFAKTIRSRLSEADFDTRRTIVEQLVKKVLIGEKFITIEFIAPLVRNNLQINSEHRTSNGKARNNGGNSQ